MKKIKILSFVFITILLLISTLLLVSQVDPCSNWNCDNARIKGCDMVCKIHDGCMGYFYEGGCEHGICKFYVTFRCVDGEQIDQIVLCSGACPI